MPAPFAPRTCRSVPVAHAYFLADVTDTGQIIGAYMDDAQFVVDLIDPNTGSASRVGVFVGLQSWHSQMAYDPNARVVYALGSNWVDVPNIYSVALGN